MIKKSETINVEEKKNLREGPGSVIMRSIASPEEMLNHGRMYSNMILKPGCGIGYHKHSGETEIFYVIEGEVVWNDGSNDTIVSSGDVMICEDGKGHAIMNNSDKDAVLNALIILK